MRFNTSVRGLLTAVGLAVLAGPGLAAGDHVESCYLSHSGKWTGTSGTLSSLSAQVANHFGDFLERAGPPRATRLMERARNLRSTSTLDGDAVYSRSNVEAIWFERLADAVRDFKGALDDLDLDCDHAGDVAVARGFHAALARTEAAEARGPAPDLAARGLALLLQEVAAATSGEARRRDPRGSYLRIPVYLAWMARVKRTHPASYSAGAEQAVRAAATAARRTFDALAQGPAATGDAAHRRRTEGVVEAAVASLLGERGVRDPAARRGHEAWVQAHRQLRYAGHLEHAPREGGGGTGDGSFGNTGTVILGTGSGDDALDAFLVKTVAYED